METCLSFDSGAEQTAASGKGRLISKDEALAIFKLAEESGLVLQPANSQDPAFICACCSCCCGVLRNLKNHPQPGSLVSNPFVAQLDDRLCAACGACSERCPMDAVTQGVAGAVLNRQRCIGWPACAPAPAPPAHKGQGAGGADRRVRRGHRRGGQVVPGRHGGG